MKIGGVKLGHATNSSSSHSIVILKDPANRPDDSELADYGWDEFVRSSNDAKKNYFAVQLFNALKGEMGGKLAAATLEGLGFGKVAGGVDHQSQIVFPHRVDGQAGLSIEWLEECKKFFLRDNVVIVGGNDNDEKNETLDHIRQKYAKDFDTVASMFPCDGYKEKLRARQDGDWWTLYNTKTGARTRMSFVDNPKPFVARTPMLVDIKITEQCEQTCEYCYQNSCADGKHANSADVVSLAYYLSVAQVFEVAIGGGNPLLHPELPRIVEAFREYGITPNLSININSIASRAELVKLARLKEYCGGVGVSVTGAEDVARWEDVRNVLGGGGQIVIHYVPFTGGLVRVLDRMRECKFHHILLLAPKFVGRGENWDGFKLAELQDECRESIIRAKDSSNIYRVSVDSCMIGIVGKEWLAEHGVYPSLVADPEGVTSMYIDAVKGVVSRSSWQSGTGGGKDVPLKNGNLISSYWEQVRDESK